LQNVLVYHTSVANTDLILQQVAADGTAIANVGNPAFFVDGGYLNPLLWRRQDGEPADSIC
jgi:hypothetical protein